MVSDSGQTEIRRGRQFLLAAGGRQSPALRTVPGTMDSPQHRGQRPAPRTAPSTADSTRSRTVLSLSQDFNPCQKPIQRNAFEFRFSGEGSTAQVALKVQCSGWAFPGHLEDYSISREPGIQISSRLLENVPLISNCYPLKRMLILQSSSLKAHLSNELIL